MRSNVFWVLVVVAVVLCWGNVGAAAEKVETWQIDMEPLARSVDLDIGQPAEVKLCDGTMATVEVLGIDVDRDSLREAVRDVRVRVKVNGVEAVIPAALYHLPREVGGVQIDCTVVKDYLPGCRHNWWSVDADARVRLWPAGSPWVKPGTFTYPVKQRWFASDTQMANEPTFVDGVESPAIKPIYYHDGLDIGGVEGVVDIVAAAEGVVVTAGDRLWENAPAGPNKVRYDKVTVLDRRGWYQMYYHLQSIDPAIQPGVRVAKGQRIGALGKGGHSGGWAHLHFEVDSRHANGRWGTEEAYAFLWQSYIAEHKPRIIAVARPHHLLAPGESVTLDGRKSWATAGPVASYEWTFTNGTKATGAKVERRYDTPGVYSEILRVTDGAGNEDIDFAVVQVVDPAKPKPLALHLAYSPTLGVKPGDPVTFTVRAFGTTVGTEMVDFGDGSAPAILQSDGNTNPLALHGYAVTTHRFATPGHYVVSARRTDGNGLVAISRVHVVVEQGR